MSCMYNVPVEKTDRINFRVAPKLHRALRAYARRYDRSESDVIREAVVRFIEADKPRRRTGGKNKR